MPDLEPLLRARSVAVVGASARPDSFGYHVVRQLLDFGYGGHIVAVNPGYSEIDGVPCYPSVSDAPGPIDCAAICVADERIEGALIAAAEAGVRAAVVFGTAAGVALDGGPLTARVGAIARNAGIALMGANCMGFFNFADRLFLTGYPYHREPDLGAISFITHSGSTLSAVAKNTRNMNFNYVISPGQELVLTAADYLDFVLRQPETSAVGMFLETIRDPERFLAALRTAEERDIPIVLLKVGRTELGARMAKAHTGAITGAHSAIEALASRYGMVLVRTMEEMLDTLELLVPGRRPTTGYLAAIADSGGERALMSDLAADAGVQFAALSDATIETLRANLDPGLLPGNPADLWGSGHDWQRVYRSCIAAMLEDDAVGAFNFGIDFNIGSRLGPDYRLIAIDAFNSTAKPFAVVANVATGLNPDDAEQLRSAGIPVLEGTETGMLAFRHLFDFSHHRMCPPKPPQNLGNQRPSIDTIRLLGLNRALTEHESLAVLAEYDLTPVPSILVDGQATAIAAAKSLGLPVVLKTAATDVVHKSDVGGVALGLSSSDAVGVAYQDLAERLGPNVVVQPQIETSSGVELFMGMTTDPRFGPLVSIGLGGIWIETLNDAVTFLAPCDASEVRRRLPALRGFKALTGARKRPAVDLDALAETVARFSRAVGSLAPWVAEIDVNPLFASGSAFTMLDALIVPVNVTSAETSTS